jgi:hypothetical protein
MKNVIKKILKEEVDNRISREDYLNKILGYLVDDTIIDFDENDENEIIYPFHPLSFYFFGIPHPPLPSSFPPYRPLSKYCKDTYGLTENEIDYVWKEYRIMINEKIKNNF